VEWNCRTDQDPPRVVESIAEEEEEEEDAHIANSDTIEVSEGTAVG